MRLPLRRMRRGEEARLYEVLRSAVIRGTVGLYDEAQRRAWAPDQPFEGWCDRLAEAECFVGLQDDLIVGFMAATPKGHLDLAYVLPELHGRGIGSLLLTRLEQEMRLRDVETMRTGASLAAQPFFARHGWVADRQETVTRAGQRLPRVRMHKILTSQADAQAS